MSYRPPFARMRAIKQDAAEARNTAEAVAAPTPVEPEATSPAPVVPEEPAGPPVPSLQMRKVELLAIAAALGLVVDDSMTKAEILALIESVPS